ncbi:MAG: NAD(P)/FAD-dependent oxidoreductase [Bradymonadaceae bacterium]
METNYLVVGAGVTGLSFANFIDSDDYVILEREPEIGGWCKTVKQDGFVWDFSGHFFHFNHPEIEEYLRERMPPDEVVTVEKNAQIIYDGNWIDFPFQKNIHQLPKDQFIECLYDVYFRDEAAGDFDPESFQGMLYEKFGKGIAEKFLVPYNEKLYACDLEELDRDAMGRFFPYADLDDIIGNMRVQEDDSYNATFTYPKNGAIMYIEALASEVPDEKIQLEEALVDIDLDRKVAHTSEGREISFEYMVSSAPFDRLMEMTDLDYDPEVFTYNKVLVFNLGFDRKGPEGVHWIYFPEKKYPFYRVGFYDNIMGTDRMSLYVEIGNPADADPDPEVKRREVMEGLRDAGLVDDHELVSHHTTTLDPAYVHITEDSNAAYEELDSKLQLRGIHSIGRYGGWTYCAIEDNIVEARGLARRLNDVAQS